MTNPNLPPRHLLQRSDKRRERPAAEGPGDGEGRERRGDGGCGGGEGFERAVGEVDGEVGGDGVEAAGGDEDGVGF